MKRQNGLKHMNNLKSTMELDSIIWGNLSIAAWSVRENAFLMGKTKVGAAVLGLDGNIYVGCNIEHVFRSHDIHAEVNAISNMVSQGQQKFKAILIVAERDKFTPCGSCMDWIMQHGGSECMVAYQNKKNGEITRFIANELMPHYPR
jgi:cytidine deaminase